MSEPQSYANHARIVPIYHVALFLTLLVNFGWAAYQLVTMPSGDSLVGLVTAVGLVILAFVARAFALTAQDRIIRLEMRLRMKDVLPAELQPRIKEFTPGQLIALRFASDSELPALSATVLKDGIQDKKTIKQMIKHWQADTLRV
jgi:Family of unknown function (DUF6526)